MKNKILEFFSWVKSFFLTLGSVFSLKEKIIITALFIILIISVAFLIYQNYLNHSMEVPKDGGTYKEGVVAQNKDEFTDTINRLTKIGLTRFDDDGKIIPEVAESWTVSDDVKTFTFVISKQFSRDEILPILEKQKDKWLGIQISAQDDNKIVFQFPEPYSPFLSSTTAPVLPYGPYKLADNNSEELNFSRNDNFYQGKPYLEKIIIKIYPNKNDLIRAYKAKEIDGVFEVQNPADFAQINTYSFELPRYNMLFFNTSRGVFKSKEIRQKIATGEKLDQELKIILVSLDNEKNRQQVNGMVNKWKDQNIQADVYFKSAQDLISKIIPEREYDVLVYGLDYGADPDPYPFWHSTQSEGSGLNLSNFSNIDADVALEEARKTINISIRQQKYDEFWRIFNDEVPAMILSQDEWTFGVSPNFKGIQTGYSIGPEDRYLKIKDWYLKTKRAKK